MALLTLGVRLIQNSENAHLEDVVIGSLATVIRMMASLRDGASFTGCGKSSLLITVLNFRGCKQRAAVTRSVRSIMRLMKQCKHREE